MAKQQLSLVRQIIDLERKAELLDIIIVYSYTDIKKSKQLSQFGNKIYFLFESVLGKNAAKKRFKQVRNDYLKRVIDGLIN